MVIKPYKLMLALDTDERRALNTFAAIASTTPNRYVESVVRRQLRLDGETLGLPLAPASLERPIEGQLTLPDAPPARARASRKAATPRRKEKQG